MATAGAAVVDEQEPEPTGGADRDQHGGDRIGDVLDRGVRRGALLVNDLRARLPQPVLVYVGLAALACTGALSWPVAVAAGCELRSARELRGLVLHAPGLPGWANLPALWHHLGFVAGHQHRIRRLALAVDGVLPSAGATLANATLHPTVRHFPYDDLDAAIGWAAAETAATPAGAVR